MQLTRNEGDLTYKVSKVPLYHTPNKDTKIFAGYGIYNAKTNGITCLASDSFVLNDNETIIKLAKRALGRSEFHNAQMTDTLFYVTIKKVLSKTISGSAYSIEAKDAMTICNSYDGSRGLVATYAIYFPSLDVVLRTPINNIVTGSEFEYAPHKSQALHDFVASMINYKLTSIEINEIITQYTPQKLPQRYSPIIYSAKDKMVQHDMSLFVPFISILKALNYWEHTQFELPIKTSQIFYTEFYNLIYGGEKI